MNRRGFSLIELLTAVVIIGILASMALIKANQIHDRATRTSMKVDLRTLLSAEESYFSAYADYTSSVSNVESKGGSPSTGTAAFRASPGNTLNLLRKGTDGWNATITNSKLVSTPKTCGIFMGPVGYSPNAKVVTAGIPVCY